MDLTKYPHIRIKGFRGKWYAYGSHTDAGGGELIFLINDELEDKAARLACWVVDELIRSLWKHLLTMFQRFVIRSNIEFIKIIRRWFYGGA